MVTAEVVMAKVALVAPAEMVTLGGTLAVALLLLDSETTAPPVGAAPLSVTVAVEEVPPWTDAGFSTREDTVGGGVTVREAAWVPPR